ncbi:MAG: Dolichyl-phosphate beta-D-mannosyltransferase [Candidatus Saccharibacteria bacterium]|nr:Dolichyl-phosphate beta-D-mannosyltransferase [Candidatus Saccharibacteria bacterium]
MYHRVFAYNFARFIAIGAIGFVVNYIVLVLLFDILSLPILLSQIIGAEIALLSTFTGNNFWAFKDHSHISVRRKLVKYNATAGLGIILTAILVTVLVNHAHLYYGLALVISSCAGLVWNYTLNTLLIFKKSPQHL